MIYKFKFEVWEDDNKTFVNGYSKESGDLIWAFSAFVDKIIRGFLTMKNPW